MIAVENVTKRFRTREGTVCALDSVNLKVDSGEFVTIVGPSGSGKTTLMFVIAGLLRPTCGRVSVCGTDVYESSSTERSRFRSSHIGFVFQMFHLVSYLNAVDNVLLASAGQPDRPQAKALMKELGLVDRLHHRPGELSVGQQQRIALARAMVANPPLILADEPTANLDRDNEAEVLGILKRFNDRGGTVVTVTHGQAAEAFATRRIELKNGSVGADS